MIVRTARARVNKQVTICHGSCFRGRFIVCRECEAVQIIWHNFQIHLLECQKAEESGADRSILPSDDSSLVRQHMDFGIIFGRD